MPSDSLLISGSKVRVLDGPPFSSSCGARARQDWRLALMHVLILPRAACFRRPLVKPLALEYGLFQSVGTARFFFVSGPHPRDRCSPRGSAQGRSYSFLKQPLLFEAG